MQTFSKCLHPERIYNRYTRQIEYVPCMKCAACLNTAASVKASALRNVIDSYRYSYMFTLTYNNDSLPRYSAIKDKNGNVQVIPVGRISDDYRYLTLCDGGRFSGKVLPKDSLYNINGEFIPYIEKDTSSVENNEFGVLSRRDVQLFLKRFRQNFKILLKRKKYNYENFDKEFSYYISGEYGPTTFRPHYHGVFSFNNPKLLDIFPYLIVKSWGISERIPGTSSKRYVRTYADVHLTRENIKLCDSNTSKYVADYIAGNTRLPKVLRLRHTRPFCLHSSSRTFRDDSVPEEKIVKDVLRGNLRYTRAEYSQAEECVVCREYAYSLPRIRAIFSKLYEHRLVAHEKKSFVYSTISRHFEEYREHLISLGHVEIVTLDDFCVYRKFHRNSSLCYRAYLRDYHTSEYLALQLDNDTSWFAVFHAFRFVCHYGKLLREFGYTCYYDVYAYVVDHIDTLVFSDKIGRFCDTWNWMYNYYGISVFFMAYPRSMEFLPHSLFKLYNDVNCRNNIYNSLLLNYGIVRKCYSNGKLSEEKCTALSEEASQFFLVYCAGERSRFEQRVKTKKKNNAMLNGQRLIS